jgi:hypothetical protein
MLSVCFTSDFTQQQTPTSRRVLGGATPLCEFMSMFVVRMATTVLLAAGHAAIATHNQLPSRHPPVPKHIYMLWDKGWHAAPEYEKACLRSWQFYNPEYTVHAINMSEAEELAQVELNIPAQVYTSLTIQSKSDIIRALIYCDGLGGSGPIPAWRATTPLANYWIHPMTAICTLFSAPTKLR